MRWAAHPVPRRRNAVQPYHSAACTGKRRVAGAGLDVGPGLGAGQISLCLDVGPRRSESRVGRARNCCANSRGGKTGPDHVQEA